MSLFEEPHLEPQPEPEKPAPQPKGDGLFRVQVGAFANRNNAEKMLERLKKAGFSGFISSEK